MSKRSQISLLLVIFFSVLVFYSDRVQTQTNTPLKAFTQNRSNLHKKQMKMELKKIPLSQSLNSFDKHIFWKRARHRLRSLHPHLKEIEKEMGVPWKLIAAVAYQESQWKHDSISRTGVKGIMMLTRQTAAFLGVQNRENLLENLWGGAKYLRYLMDEQPQHLNQKERWMIALAAYNVGPGHLRDAQYLAVQFGLNPYKWRHLRRVLPLLSDQNIAKSLSFGFARGYEPVVFVQRTLAYYDLLLQSSKNLTEGPTESQI